MISCSLDLHFLSLTPWGTDFVLYGSNHQNNIKIDYFTPPKISKNEVLHEGVWGGSPEDRIPPKICPEDGIPNYWVEVMEDRIRMFLEDVLEGLEDGIRPKIRRRWRTK